MIFLFPLPIFKWLQYFLVVDLIKRDKQQDEQYLRQHLVILEKWNKEAEVAIRACQDGEDLLDEWSV